MAVEITVLCCIMLAYAYMQHILYYAQNSAGIIHQGLTWSKFGGC